MSTNFAININNDKIKEAYNASLENRITKVSKTAGSAVESFASLIDQINKLQNEAKGNKKVQEAANEMNNTMVMATRMLAAHLEVLNKVTTPEIQ